MNEQHGHRYEFGEFQLDPTERVLFHHGEHVRLQPKTFETLLALIEHSGHVVRKEALMERVWPDAFVEEINLTKNISTLRKTLGNGNGAGKFIETIPTVGYRFVAEVREVEQGAGEGKKKIEGEKGRKGEREKGDEQMSVSPSPSLRPRIWRRLWFWCSLALLLLIGVSLAWWVS